MISSILKNNLLTLFKDVRKNMIEEYVNNKHWNSIRILLEDSIDDRHLYDYDTSGHIIKKKIKPNKTEYAQRLNVLYSAYMTEYIQFLDNNK